METRIIVGLGNPGNMYKATRHNVGFDVVEEICKRQDLRLKPGYGEYFFCETRVRTAHVILVKPLTYMNNSGEAVVDVLQRFEGVQSSMLVIVDDFSLPLGTLRLRPKGSDGGHNGLKSIIYELQSLGFPRLRCGIGRTETLPREKVTDFVLSPFDQEETEAVHDMVGRASDACMEFAASGLTRTMNSMRRT